MIKKKVLHLVEDLGVGGLERVLATIVLGLDKRKFDVEVWCLAEGGEVAAELVQKGIKLKVLGLKGYYNPLKIIFLARLFTKSRIDILHTHGYFAGTFGRLSAILARTPIVIAHVHTTYYGFSRRNRYIEKFLSYFTDQIVCVSMAVQKFVVNVEKINPAKTCVIYNAATVSDSPDLAERAENERLQLGITENDFVAISVASLTPHKGHHILLDAAGSVLREYPKFKLLIVGAGPLRNELETHAKKSGIFNNTIFTGLRENVFPLLKIANIFILASIEREGLGIALIEAMAAGLPVIGTRLGGIPEVVQENMNGILISPGNTHELALAIKMLMKNHGLREKMGNDGQRIYREKFTATQMIRNVESLYAECENLRLR